MPTIFSHVAVPIATSLGVGKIVSPRLLFFAAFCAILPDFDTIGFTLGIAYASQWGRRGFTHSIGFAMALAVVAMCFNRQFKSRAWVIFMLVFIATLSHPLLDMLTRGGLGVALYWPYSNERVFFDYRPIAVSSIGISHFFNARGWAVLKSELIWVWLPSVVSMFTLRGMRRR